MPSCHTSHEEVCTTEYDTVCEGRKEEVEGKTVDILGVVRPRLEALKETVNI